MILTGNKIYQEWSNGIIKIVPFTKNNITTNSYDLTLGDEFLVYKNYPLDPRIDNEVERIGFDNKGSLELSKGDFVLGSSKEVIGSDTYVPIIHSKSSIARLGLFVHVTSDLIDIGSFGNVTFQLYATLPIILKQDMSIAQVTFRSTSGNINLYSGKYQNSKGPIASRSHLDI